MLYCLNNLSYTYPGADKQALSSITLQIEEGEFILLQGPSGGGKSTLLRALSGVLGEFYGGAFEGGISFFGKSLFQIPPQNLRRAIGMVFQDPEKQIVMKRVEQEIAFGLENLGLDRRLMRRRVLESASYLGLLPLLQRNVNEISSGELQKVALASVLAMMPQVLLLDEPTSQLSPRAAAEFFSLLSRLHADFGMTVVLVEQRLDECFALSDRVLLVREGSVIFDSAVDSPSSLDSTAAQTCLPAIAGLFSPFRSKPADYSVRSCRKFIKDHLRRDVAHGAWTAKRAEEAPEKREILFEAQKVCVSYPGTTKSALSEVSFALERRECLSLVGDNGAGKTTLLRAIAGEVQISSGRMLFHSQPGKQPGQRAQKIAYLSQDPNAYLFNDTVEEELRYSLRNLGQENELAIKETLAILGLESVAKCYPRDLSSGERQRVALGSILVMRPEILLLDEPTRGSDPETKPRLVQLIRDLTAEHGMAVVIATQDMEFAASVSHNAALLSCGHLLDYGRPSSVFGGNISFTTRINRVFRSICDSVVTLEDAREFLEANADVF